ncbi:anti-sigma factor domain-containing protein [Clostridium sp. MSJ-11]|uniref:Anti-sigma factor domain-containing protein n=1 Tax=Clostridium mobile TaxID=2841512 RepID=A0ABS6EH19_9CLOT|nr:anti-sigma factor domain-containing protein [Clostridium mobile]MBU5484508.1 anti-sigma factor domain-containing protein [Clostridium mobile]
MIYKGTIIEICHDSIVVMAEDCTFKRIKKSQGLQEGMEIYFEERDIIKKSNSTTKGISGVAAAIFIFIATSIYALCFWNENYRSVALLAVDINPSVEMNINKNYRVIQILALNEEASKLPLESLKNYSVTDALEKIVEMAEAEGYIKKDESNHVLVTSVELKSNNESNEDLDQLLIEGKEKIEKVSNERGQQVEVVTIKSDRETLNEAKKEHISVGKMEIYKKTKDENEKQDKKEVKRLKDKKVKELIKQAEKNEKIKRINSNNNNKVNKEKSVKEDKKNSKDKKDKKEKDSIKEDKYIEKHEKKNKDKAKDKEKNKDKKSEEP